MVVRACRIPRLENPESCDVRALTVPLAHVAQLRAQVPSQSKGWVEEVGDQRMLLGSEHGSAMVDVALKQ